MNKNSIVYISLGDVSVYESQVLELLRYYAQRKNIHVILVQGYSSSKEKKRLEKKISNYPELLCDMIWYRTYPAYLFFEPLHLFSIKKALSSIANIDQYTIHVRSEFCGYLVQKVISKIKFSNKIIVDIRGVVLEELYYKLAFNKSNIRRFLISRQIKYWKKFYDYFFSQKDSRLIISSVSSEINCYIKKKYPSCAYPLMIHPNIAGEQFIYNEENRYKIRETLGIPLDARVAICATGSNASWQKDEETIETLTKQGIYVINLSKHTVDIPRCITMTIPFTQMPSYLSAADIAVLWREENFINWSASPSKLSEFAAMGLWIIHNKHVANAVEYIRSTGAGILVDTIEEIQTGSYNNNRESRLRSGQQYFSVQAIAESYISTYNK